MLKDSTVVAIRLPLEHKELFRATQYKCRAAGIPFYKILEAACLALIEDKKLNAKIAASLDSYADGIKHA